MQNKCSKVLGGKLVLEETLSEIVSNARGGLINHTALHTLSINI